MIWDNFYKFDYNLINLKSRKKKKIIVYVFSMEFIELFRLLNTDASNKMFN